MKAAARLTGDLLARQGQATPTGGFAAPAIAPSQPLPAPERRGRVALVQDGDERQRPGLRRDAGQRVALTVRLDRERHRRLRIFGARHGCTNQEVILEALDAYLAACGFDCACLRDAAADCSRN